MVSRLILTCTELVCRLGGESGNLGLEWMPNGKGAHADKQEKYFKEVILKLEQAPESPVGLVRTQSSRPYPRIFDLVGL